MATKKPEWSTLAELRDSIIRVEISDTVRYSNNILSSVTVATVYREEFTPTGRSKWVQALPVLVTTKERTIPTSDMLIEFAQLLGSDAEIPPRNG